MRSLAWSSDQDEVLNLNFDPTTDASTGRSPREDVLRQMLMVGTIYCCTWVNRLRKPQRICNWI